MDVYTKRLDREHTQLLVDCGTPRRRDEWAKLASGLSALHDVQVRTVSGPPPVETMLLLIIWGEPAEFVAALASKVMERFGQELKLVTMPPEAENTLHTLTAADMARQG